MGLVLNYKLISFYVLKQRQIDNKIQRNQPATTPN